MNIFRSLYSYILGIYQVSLEELRRITSDSGAILFFFIVPFLYPFLYSALYGNEGIHDAPMVVVDYNQSTLSRELIRRIDASPDVAIVSQVSNEAEAYKLIASEDAYAILIIPQDFGTRIAQGKQATIDLHTTFAATLYYRAYTLTSTDIALAMGREIESFRHYGSSEEATRIAVRPIESEWLVPYNTQGGFQGYLLPGILVLIIQQTILIGLAMLYGTERDRSGCITTHTAQHRGLLGSIQLICGRILPYLFIYFIDAFFVLIISPEIFGTPQLTDGLTYFTLLLPMLLSMICFGLFCGFFTPQREQSMLLLVFTSLPFMFLSGLSWPWPSIPAPLKALAVLIPSTPGVQGFIALNSMGATIHDIMPQYLLLWGQAIVYFSLTLLVYTRYQRRG